MILPSRLQTILMKPTEKGMHRFSGVRERDSFRKLIESRQVLTCSHPVATINYCIVEGFYKIRYLGSKGEKNETWSHLSEGSGPIEITLSWERITCEPFPHKCH